MTPARIRKLEALGFVIQWILVGAAVWGAFSIPFLRDQLPAPALASTGVADAPPSEPVTTTSADQLKGIWERNLRQLLIEPKPQPKEKPKPPPPPPPVRLPKLLATFVEHGQAWGLFVGSAGDQRVRSASGRVDDFDIVSISPGRAQLSRDGQTHEVKTAQREERGRG